MRGHVFCQSSSVLPYTSFRVPYTNGNISATCTDFQLQNCLRLRTIMTKTKSEYQFCIHWTSDTPDRLGPKLSSDVLEIRYKWRHFIAFWPTGQKMCPIIWDPIYPFLLYPNSTVLSASTKPRKFSSLGKHWSWHPLWTAKKQPYQHVMYRANWLTLHNQWPPHSYRLYDIQIRMY